jgi:hypothetical protein
MRALILVTLFLSVLAPAGAQTVYRTGNTYSDIPGGTPVRVSADTNIVQRVWAPVPVAAPGPVPQVRVHREHRREPIVVNVTVNNPAPVFIEPRRNYLAGGHRGKR